MTLQASQLAYARGDSLLFSGVNLEVGPGEALRVTGRNGAGKTSLLRVLCGLTLPLEGEVSWRGTSVVQDRESLHRDLIYIGHGQTIKDEFSALENVQISAVLAGRSCTRRQALEALNQLGLRDRADLPARVLSQGQRRRVALARLALPAPESGETSLLVLDEPFVALDQESVGVLAALLAARLARGAVLVYTTHQAQTLSAKCTHELNLGVATGAEAV